MNSSSQWIHMVLFFRYSAPVMLTATRSACFSPAQTLHQGAVEVHLK